MLTQIESVLDELNELREYCGRKDTLGLKDDTIIKFMDRDPALLEAVRRALDAFHSMDAEEQKLLRLDENSLAELLQEKFVNFYPKEGVNPYIPLAASGPWIVTTHGAVLHDSGGYGMLGMGHSPEEINEVIAKPWVMANVMTPSLSQKRFTDRLSREIGHTRSECPFTRFICMNSGSEAVTITARITDIHAKIQTDPGAQHSGKSIRTLALEDGFHGRTGFPAKLSHSTRDDYERYLASFREDMKVDFIPVNDEAQLVEAYQNADREGIFYQAFYICLLYTSDAADE